MRVRRSVRRYTDRPLPDSSLDHLRECAAEAAHLRHPGARVTVVNGREQVDRILTRYAGIYGLVQGAPHLIVGLLPEDEDLHRLDLGYALEQVVLEATRLELGTCWMTGSYHPDEAAQEIDRRPSEIVAAAVALGHPREDLLAQLHDGAIRSLVGARQRKPLKKLVFDGKWGQSWSPKGADPALVEMLECARWAPSAHNGQPWRFILQPDRINLAVEEPAPIDAGIAMSHIALAGEELGRPGRWTVRLDDPELAHRLDLPSRAVPVGVWQTGDSA